MPLEEDEPDEEEELLDDELLDEEPFEDELLDEELLEDEDEELRTSPLDFPPQPAIKSITQKQMEIFDIRHPA